MRSVMINVVLLALSPMAFAADIYVPDDHAKIQDAINAAVDGDTVIVRPGTYVENIDFVGKAISVKSEHGPLMTVIDGGWNKTPVVRFFNNEERDSLIVGFTITNGYAEGDGGGIYVLHGGSPTIRNNIIINNRAVDDGGGIMVHVAAINRETPLIDNNIVAFNRCGNTSGNQGGGICCYNAVTIINNTIFGNISGHGGGIYCKESYQSIITNTILWDNSDNQGYPEIRQGDAIVSYCNVKGGCPGTGNIDADPLFLDSANGDFHIPFDSPCRSAGDRNAPNLPDTDFEGDPRTGLFAFPDIGADEFHTHFYVNGTVSAGSTATAVIIGWPKTNPVMLISGSGILPAPDPTPYGDFWLMPPWNHRVHFNAMPVNGVRIIDRVVTTGLPPGTQIPFQALVGTELSNLWVVDIE